MQSLSKAEIRTGLEKVNDGLASRETKGEICLYGGACLCPAVAARSSTKEGGHEEDDSVTDLNDAIWLCRHLGISSREAVARVVLRYFPDRELPERTGFFVEELSARIDET